MKIMHLTRHAVFALIAVVLGSTPMSLAAPIRVVILSGQNVHDWKATTPFLEKMYTDAGRFRIVETVNDVSRITAATFARCDVIVSNWTCHPVMTGGPWTPEGTKAFADAVRGGKGFVQFHAACSACNDWSEFQELSGVTWKWGFTNHTSYHTFKIVNREARHPITRDVPDFWITDELYQKMVKMGKSDFHVLMNAFAEPDFGGIGTWEPMLITTQLGKGRGVNFLLGHDVHAMQNVAWRTLMLRSTEWAATGKVSTPIPEDWPGTAAAADMVGVDIDAAFKGVAGYAFGQSRQPLVVVDQYVLRSTSRPGKKAVAERIQLAARLAATISVCKTSEGKAFLCSQLARIGTLAEVSAIAPLLADEGAAMMARFSLERITGPASAQALRDAVPRLKGKLKTGVVNSLGNKADADAVTLLAPLAGVTDADLAMAAVAALGKIGTTQAAEVLRVVRPRALEVRRDAIADAYLNCAERLFARGEKHAAAVIYRELYQPSESGRIRAAAMHGLILRHPSDATRLVSEALDSKVPELQAMAAYVVRNLPQCGDTSAIARYVHALPPKLQGLMLSALGDRGDRAALSVVRGALLSSDEATRITAIQALGSLGDETDVPRLATSLKGGEAERNAARLLLSGLKAPGADRAIVAFLRSDDETLRTESISILVNRNARDQILKEIDHAAASQNVTMQVALIRVLHQIGDDRSLAAVRTAIRSNPGPVRQAALATLESWPTPAAFQVLLEAARDRENGPHASALMQAVLRLLPVVVEQHPDELGAHVESVMRVAPRAEDKQAVLAVIGGLHTIPAMDTAMSYLGDPATADPAGLAAARVAVTLDDSQRDRVKKAMQKIMANSKSAETLKAAEAALRKATQPINLARRAEASSPDGLESDGAASGDRAAIDGDPGTYWDEANNAKLYVLRLDWKQPIRCSRITIRGHAFESCCPKDFDIVCDGKIVKTVRNAVYERPDVTASFAFTPTECRSLELRITGYYGESPAIRELEVYDAPDVGAATSAPSVDHGPPAFTWQQTESTIALLNHQRPVWQFNYAKSLAKSYFHPLNLPDGTELVCLSPPDHPWHHALWFAWKGLNGINYWETGNVPGGGFTEVTAAKVETNADFSARLELSISYHPADKPPVLTEQRVISVSLPGADGSYHIDWTGTFTAGSEDVQMKGGTVGGGYAGMSARISQNSRDWELIDSEGRRDVPGDGMTKNTHGQRSRWADFTLVDTHTALPAGIAIFDHPSNLRFPSQWHDVMERKTPFGYLSPAPLWSEPYTLPAGKDLTLRYRILVHPGRSDPARLEAEFQAFRAQKQPD